MTTQERAVLERIEGKIDALDTRLRAVEQRIAALDATADAREAARSSFIASRRWVVGLVVSAAIGAAGLALTVARAFAAV